MAHNMKFTRAACGHMFKHYERAKDENGEYLKFGNEDIDASRTHLNYNLAPMQANGQGGFVKERCSEVKMQNRKDVNVMCSWVVTAPKEIREDETEIFFRETYKFLSERYGRDNVVSAYVHMDETTPHIHFAFVPVVTDKKKGGLKVSAKEAIDKKELQVFHGDLSKHMEKIFERDIGIENGATKGGNKNKEQLKVEAVKKEFEEVEKQTEKILSENQFLVDEIVAQKQELTDLRNEKITLRDELNQERKNFTDMQQKFKPRKDDLKKVNKIKSESKPNFVTNKVSLTKEDYEFFIKIAEQHARISDTTLTALENQDKITAELKRCQSLYLAVATVATELSYSDRSKLKQSVQDMLKDIEDWRSVSWLIDGMTGNKPSSLAKIIEAREKQLKNKQEYAKKIKDYNQPNPTSPKTTRKRSQERD